jgi:hypothetical protein
MLFDTLSKENCVFFLILSIISFALFVVMFVTAIVSTKKLPYFIASLTPLVFYYIYLLYYSMCVNSLK